MGIPILFYQKKKKVHPRCPSPHLFVASRAAGEGPQLRLGSHPRLWRCSNPPPAISWCHPFPWVNRCHHTPWATGHRRRGCQFLPLVSPSHPHPVQRKQDAEVSSRKIQCYTLNLEQVPFGLGVESLGIRFIDLLYSHLFSVFYWSNYSQGIGSSCPVEIRIPQSTFIWFPVLGLLLFFYFNLFNLFAVCLICAWGVGNSCFDCG